MVLLVGLGLASCLHMTGCSFDNIRSAKFATEMENCYERSSSCSEFVACQHRAQVEAGKKPTGSCDDPASEEKK